MNIKYLTIVLGVAGCIAACGGSGSAPEQTSPNGQMSSPPPANTIAGSADPLQDPGGSEINGIKVPKSPDETVNSSTLVGIDSDGNNIRDDIDRFLAIKYGKADAMYASMRAIASAFQAIAAAPKSISLPDARDLLTKVIDDELCGIEKTEAKTTAVDQYALAELFFRTYNTAERLEKLKQVNFSAGAFVYRFEDSKCQ